MLVQKKKSQEGKTDANMLCQSTWKKGKTHFNLKNSWKKNKWANFYRCGWRSRCRRGHCGGGRSRCRPGHCGGERSRCRPSHGGGGRSLFYWKQCLNMKLKFVTSCCKDGDCPIDFFFLHDLRASSLLQASKQTESGLRIALAIGIREIPPFSHSLTFATSLISPVYFSWGNLHKVVVILSNLDDFTTLVPPLWFL